MPKIDKVQQYAERIWMRHMTNQWYISSTACTTGGTIIYDTTATGGNYAYWGADNDWAVIEPGESLAVDVNRNVQVPLGKAFVLALPDGSKIGVDQYGNYRIDDKDSKVVYEANRRREFNRYINSADLVADFIRFVGSLGVRQSEVPRLPLALFVNWLVLEAAAKDHDQAPPDVGPVERHPLLLTRVRPRCLLCKRFVRRITAEQGFQFCNPAHAERHFKRIAA